MVYRTVALKKFDIVNRNLIITPTMTVCNMPIYPLVEICWEREMFYLTKHSNTFYLWLYGVRHMVKDYSDSEKGNPLLPHRLLLYVYMHHPTDRITHTTAFVTPVVEHWLEREIAQWVHPMKDWSDDPPHHEQTLYLCRNMLNASLNKKYYSVSG